MRPQDFRFQPNRPLAQELSVARLEALRKGIMSGSPATGGHKGINILQSPFGWTANIPNGGRSVSTAPLRLSQIPNRTSAVSAAEDRFFIRWGNVNRVIPTNIDDGFDLTAETWFFLQLTLAPNSQLVTAVEIVTGTSSTDYTDGSWGSNGEPPDPWHWLIGYVAEVDGALQIAGNNAGGNLSVSVVTGSFMGGGATPIAAINHIVALQS